MTIVEVIRSVLVWAEWFVLGYFLVINSFYFILLISAAWEMHKHSLEVRSESLWRLLGSEVAPAVSVLAPAYNEARTITQSVQALLTLYYPSLEIVVINDGSPDETLDILIEEFSMEAIHLVYQQQIACKPIRGLYRSRLYPNLLVVDKENGGKADALNCGLNLASGELVCAIDADTIIEPDAIQRMVRPFLQGSDVLAAGGTIRPVNSSRVKLGQVKSVSSLRNPVAGFQALEYIRAFLFGRLGWNLLGGNLIISGAFGLFKRNAVLEVGGYAHDTVGEDMELVLSLRRKGYETGKPNRVDFIPDPVAWTEVPESLRTLGKQRDRWHRGLADVLWRHREVMFNPRYGALGMLAYPYFVIVELLSPLVEAFGLISVVVSLAIGAINIQFAVLFLLAAYGYGLLLTTFTLVMDEFNYHRYQGFRDRLLLILWMLFENLGYRQLTVLWRLNGLFKYIRGKKDWGKMERRGFQSS